MQLATSFAKHAIDVSLEVSATVEQSAISDLSSSILKLCHAIAADLCTSIRLPGDVRWMQLATALRKALPTHSIAIGQQSVISDA